MPRATPPVKEIGVNRQYEKIVYFFMKGYLERQTGKYIMDSKCKCYDYYIKTKSKKSINKLKIMKMNEWINKYNHENIQPNGYQKYGQFIC